jgi:hypothetical protein
MLLESLLGTMEALTDVEGTIKASQLDHVDPEGRHQSTVAESARRLRQLSASDCD